MPEQLTPAQQDLQAHARRFAREELLPRAAAADAGTRSALTEASKRAGFFYMTQPQAFGGSAAGPLELVLVREAFAGISPGPATGVFGPAPGVLAGCGEPLRSSHLAPLLAGEKQGGFGFTEPADGGSPTTGVFEGDHIRINGRKSYVTGGQNADFINTLVHIDGQPALVVIDTDAPGVRRSRDFESLDGSRHAAFVFENVRVPRSHLLAEPGDGMPRALAQIGDVRLGIAADCSGRALWLSNWLTDYLKAPGRNGKPRGDRDAVRLRFGQLLVATFGLRAALYRAARIAARAETRADSLNEVMAIKVLATETLQQLVDQAIQLVGGEALVTDHPLARLYQQTRALRLAEGPTDLLYQNVARGRLDLDKGRL